MPTASDARSYDPNVATTHHLETDLDGLVRVTGAWDDLAIELGEPACSPAVMLGWKRWLAPDMEIVTVLVYDDVDLVGVAPFVLDRSSGRKDVRVMGAALLHRIGLLARNGYEQELAGAVGVHLGSLSPRPDVIALEGVATSEGWPAAVREGFRGIMHTGAHWTSRGDAPIVTIGGNPFEAWMATRSANFRSDMRRARRRLEKRGGRVRLVTGASADIESAVSALGALHRGRWTPEGYPGIIDTAAESMMLEVARAQPDGERFRLWVVELEDRVIGAQVFFAAGGNVIYWNGGWDQDHSDLKPGMLGILAAIEDAADRGERRLDLGGGAQSYKLRFADSVDPLEWAVIAPFQRRYPRTRLELLRQQSRWKSREALHLLPPGTRARIKAVVRR